MEQLFNGSLSGGTNILIIYIHLASFRATRNRSSQFHTTTQFLISSHHTYVSPNRKFRPTQVFPCEELVYDESIFKGDM